MTAKTIKPSRKDLTTNDRNKLELRDVPGKGLGVFAKRGFNRGEHVLEFFGKRVDREELHDLKHALQIGPRTFLTASGDLDDYVNHDCDPNSGIRDDAEGHVVLFALRDIAPGEEITFDYATTQANGFWSMTCDCGSPYCRKLISDWKDIPPQRQQKYLTQGAVLKFLKK